jgi:hypothetical protein
MYTETWPENQKERNYLGDLGIHYRMLLILTLKKWGVRMLTGFILLKLRVSSGLFGLK